jgi:hypothetical protein
MTHAAGKIIHPRDLPQIAEDIDTDQMGTHVQNNFRLIVPVIFTIRNKLTSSPQSIRVNSAGQVVCTDGLPYARYCIPVRTREVTEAEKDELAGTVEGKAKLISYGGKHWYVDPELHGVSCTVGAGREELSQRACGNCLHPPDSRQKDNCILYILPTAGQRALAKVFEAYDIPEFDSRFCILTAHKVPKNGVLFLAPEGVYENTPIVEEESEEESEEEPEEEAREEAESEPVVSEARAKKRRRLEMELASHNLAPLPGALKGTASEALHMLQDESLNLLVRVSKMEDSNNSASIGSRCTEAEYRVKELSRELEEIRETSREACLEMSREMFRENAALRESLNNYRDVMCSLGARVTKCTDVLFPERSESVSVDSGAKEREEPEK